MTILLPMNDFSTNDIFCVYIFKMAMHNNIVFQYFFGLEKERNSKYSKDTLCKSFKFIIIKRKKFRCKLLK